MNTKLHLLALTTAAGALLLAGCESPNGTPDNTGTGALMGGAIGALAGAAIAGPHDAGAGALIGAAAGVIGGGLIGHAMDQQQAEALRQQAPQTYVRVEQGQPLGIADIKALARAGVSDEVIISQIRSSHTVFHLSSADIIDLHSAGVSDRVIDFMINTPSTIGEAAPVQATVIEQAPPPPPPQTVVVAPGPGYVWVDGEWVWRGRWVWIGGHWAYPPHPEAVWVHGYWHRGPYGWYHVQGYWW
ncbi:MAG: YXWGXW repeat-containing protein [Verrucomicrobiota bacterium]|nr:YXWGXW repeat-containing protein [Verrucomicrobiota bacterium]